MIQSKGCNLCGKTHAMGYVKHDEKAVEVIFNETACNGISCMFLTYKDLRYEAKIPLSNNQIMRLKRKK